MLAWILRGDIDSLVVEGLERVEELMAAAGDALSPRAQADIERKRENVFGRMKARDSDGALREVSALEKMTETAAHDGGFGSSASMAPS